MPRKSAATTVDPRRVASDPYTFKGQNVVIAGLANNVEPNGDYTRVQLMAQVPGVSNAPSLDIVVILRPKHSDVLSSECYRVYGVMSGTSSVRNLLTGAERQVATMAAYAVEPGRRGGYGIGSVV